MGDISKVIDVIFAGVDNVSNVVDTIEGNMGSIGSGLGDIAAPFEKATDAVLLLDAAVVAASVGVLAFSAEVEQQSVKMVNSLGLTTEEAKKFEQVAKDVYSQGYGDDLAASFEAVTLAQQKFGDSAETDIKKVVTSAMELEKTFGVEYTESLGAVKTLMTNFGLSADEAFDFIAAGYQKGLNGSDDFLESVNEYATQFSNGGADAGQFFSVLETGFQEGMLGTDKAADAFKEFRVRIQDGSTSTQDALNKLGLGQSFMDSMSTGETTAVEAFQTIVSKMGDVKDSSDLMQIGVALIGTQFEDIGTQAALSLSTTKTSMEDLKGTMSTFDSTTLTQNFTSMWRTAIVSVSEMDMWSSISDRANVAFASIASNFSAVFKDYDFSDLEATFEALWSKIAGGISDEGLDLTTVDGMRNAVDLVVESISSLATTTEGMVDIVRPLVSFILDLTTAYNDLDGETKELIGSVATLGTGLGVIGTALSVGGTVIGGFASIAEVVSVGGALSTGLGALVALLTGPAGLAVALGVAGAALISWSASETEAETKRINEALTSEIETINELAAQIDQLSDTTPTVEIYAKLEAGDYTAAQKLIDEALAKDRLLKVQAEVEQTEFNSLWEKLVSLDGVTTAEIQAVANASSLKEAETILDKLSAERTASVKLQAETKAATETIEVWTETNGVISIEVPVNTDKIKEAKKEVEQIPTERQIEITLQGEIDTQLATIEANAETIQAAMQFKASIDIENIKSVTAQVEAAFASVDTSIESTGDVISSALSTLTQDTDFQTKWAALEVLEQEQDYREQSMQLQKDLVEAQTKYLDARTDALQSGETAIKITADGLEPSLQMIMFEVIKKVQIVVNEEGLATLMGV